jgi:hypothetical protein
MTLNSCRDYNLVTNQTLPEFCIGFRARISQRLCIVPHLILGGLSILQCADDTVVLLDHNLEYTRIIKLLCTLFQKKYLVKK